MADPHLLCDPSEKAKFEAKNGVELIDYISYLVNDQQITEIRESHVLEFHKLTIENIYPCGGKYRDLTRNVQIQGSEHELPEPARVPGLVRELVDKLNSDRGTLPTLTCAAYALWRLNWIHPFSGGNGRSARSLAYLVICNDLRQVPPGLPQMPTSIYERRDEYVAGLKAADAGELKNGHPNLGPMEDLMEEVITRQLASAIHQLSRKPSG